MTADEAPEADVEALAWLFATCPIQDARDIWHDYSRALLTSDWLAEHDAKVSAEAWDEGWDERDNDCSEPYSPHRRNPYRIGNVS